MDYGSVQSGLNTIPLGLDVSSNPYGPDTAELLQRLQRCADTLDVSRLTIISLPPLPSGLKVLKCNNTPLSSLPELPESLEALYCYDTNLTTLPLLPSSLKELYCHRSPIESLPSLPASLKNLMCSATRIPVLPALPSNLEEVWCGYTNLHALPDLPPNLLLLSVEHTPLTSLPELPSSLQYLHCTNTDIKDLPDLPPLEVLYACMMSLGVQQNDSETITQYALRLTQFKEEQASKRRSQGRCGVLKEDLIAEAMHPRRIGRLLDTYGFDVLECI